jgi:hypothetical protein
MEGMAHTVRYLPGKYKALGSTPAPIKEKSMKKLQN